MESSTRSLEFKSLYIARFSLELGGVLLVIFALFSSVIVHALHKGMRGGDGLGNAIVLSAFSLATGIGLLLRLMWTKLLASFLLAMAAVWIFLHDAYRWSNLEVYFLLLLPLLLTLWLRAGYSKFKIERLPSANKV
jgi:hypothetical protein